MSTSVLADAIAALDRYISRLQAGPQSPDVTAKIALYAERRAAYQARLQGSADPIPGGYYGSPDAPPDGQTESNWLAGASRDTYGWLMQLLYVQAHPTVTLAASAPYSLSRPGERQLSIGEIGLEFLGAYGPIPQADLQDGAPPYPELTTGEITTIGDAMWACQSSSGEHGDGTGTPHVGWSDAEWALVGGVAAAAYRAESAPI